MSSERGRDKFNRYESIFMICVRLVALLPLRLRKVLFSHSRNIQGLKGFGIRYILVRSLARKCGKNVSIRPGVYLFNVERISLGDNVSIHPMCYIDASGGIEIGNDVSIAHGVTIMSTSHTYGRHDIPIKDQDVVEKSVIINSNVWSGAKATILGGNVIGSGSIVAAGCVVTHNVESDVIVGGVPGKIIKKR